MLALHMPPAGEVTRIGLNEKWRRGLKVVFPPIALQKKKGKRTGLNRPRLPGCVLGVTELDAWAQQRLPGFRESVKKIFAPLLVAMADQAH